MKIFIALLLLLAMGPSYGGVVSGNCKIKVRPFWICYGGERGEEKKFPCGLAFGSIKKVKMDTSLSRCAEMTQRLHKRYKHDPQLKWVRTKFKFKSGDLKVRGKAK